MSKLLDYLDWRGDLPLAAAAFSEVDNLLFAKLSYLNFEGIVPPPEIGKGVPLRDAAAAYFERHASDGVNMGVLVPEQIPNLLCAMARSRRFGSVLLNGYEERINEQTEQQFAALTAELGDGSVYVAFRGTDDTLVGWKEDLNLSFLEKIPSQQCALTYLERIAKQYPRRPLRVGGHSKGGNLAVYGAVYAPEAVQKRILRVYNNDGPGFGHDISETEEHSRIAERILTLVPQSSVVGMLLEHEEHYEIVHSCETGLMQHNGFSWEVLGDRFVRVDRVSRGGKLADETLELWEASLTPQQKENVVNALYEVLSGTGARTLSDLSEEKRKSAAAILKTYKNLDATTRQLLAETLRLLFRAGRKPVLQNVQENELEALRKKLEDVRRRLFEKK